MAYDSPNFSQGLLMSRSPTRATWTVACAFVLLVATTLLGQQLQRGTADPAEITRMVTKMVEENHLRQTPINDEVSEKLLKTWFGDLDSQKLYFLQSDIDSFANQKDQLDDALKAGNLDFAYDSFKLYLKRLEERIAYAQTLIDSPFDFKVNETMDTDPKLLEWAKTPAEINERWRKRIKFDILSMKLDEQPDGEIQTRLHKRYRMIANSIKTTEKEEVMEMYLTALCSVFDPHSSYMSPRTRREFDMHMKLKLTGIGAVLRSEDGQTIVAEVVPGGAAAKDGRLKMGDKITGVSDENGEIIDIVEMKLTKVVEKIRGKAGTQVKLRVLTKEGSLTKEYDMIRQVVEIKSQEVKGEIIDASTRVKGANPSRIGVISIPSFYRDFEGAEEGQEDYKSTVRDVKLVLEDFKAKGGVDLVVVDLRDNPGGALAEAIEVSGLFIDRGPVVQVKDPRHKVRQLNDEESGVACKDPLVVLINRHSASASEIFAGVIKDYGRGIIVGDTTTHGKGTVQSVMDVGPMFRLNPRGPDRGSLKITIQQFYRVNGESTQHQGVPSDIKLPSLLDVADQGESGLENALPFEKIEVAKHGTHGLVNGEILASLQDASRKRVAADPEFQKATADMAKYMERKDRKQISLNYEELKKEQTVKTKEEKEKLEDPPTRKSDGPIFLSDAYNNEILSISTDYLKLLGGLKTASKK